MSFIENEAHRMDQYMDFCARYGISNWQDVVQLYDVDDLERFLPLQPTALEKQALSELVGITGIKGGYMDYEKAQNTFELVMQWQERTGNHGNNALFFRTEGDIQP
jgi:hypothetical protein